MKLSPELIKQCISYIHPSNSYKTSSKVSKAIREGVPSLVPYFKKQSYKINLQKDGLLKNYDIWMKQNFRFLLNSQKSYTILMDEKLDLFKLQRFLDYFTQEQLSQGDNKIKLNLHITSNYSSILKHFMQQLLQFDIIVTFHYYNICCINQLLQLPLYEVIFDETFQLEKDEVSCKIKTRMYSSGQQQVSKASLKVSLDESNILITPVAITLQNSHSQLNVLKSLKIEKLKELLLYKVNFSTFKDLANIITQIPLLQRLYLSGQQLDQIIFDLIVFRIRYKHLLIQDTSFDFNFGLFISQIVLLRDEITIELKINNLIIPLALLNASDFTLKIFGDQQQFSMETLKVLALAMKNWNISKEERTRVELYHAKKKMKIIIDLSELKLSN